MKPKDIKLGKLTILIGETGTGKESFAHKYITGPVGTWAGYKILTGGVDIGKTLNIVREIVREVRRGMTTILITYVPESLEQIENLIRLSQIDMEKRTFKYGYGENEYLYPDEVKVYRFIKDGDKVEVESIKVDILEGIDNTEFMRFIAPLYEESLKLQEDIVNLQEES